MAKIKKPIWTDLSSNDGGEQLPVGVYIAVVKITDDRPAWYRERGGTCVGMDIRALLRVGSIREATDLIASIEAKERPVNTLTDGT